MITDRSSPICGLPARQRRLTGWSELASVPERPDRVLAGLARVP